MNVTQLLAKKILEQATHYEWSLQGFGMFRLYLAPQVRLHVWDSRFAVKDVTTIHTHPWHFDSTVIAGCIIDRLYSIRSVLPETPATHVRQRIVCGPGGGKCDEPAVGVVLHPLQEIRVTSTHTIETLPNATYGREGSKYSMTAQAAHETRYHDGTITIIEREPLPDAERAYVFIPVGQEWVSAEPRAATTDEVIEMRAKALDMLETTS